MPITPIDVQRPASDGQLRHSGSELGSTLHNIELNEEDHGIGGWRSASYGNRTRFPTSEKSLSDRGCLHSTATYSRESNGVLAKTLMRD